MIILVTGVSSSPGYKTAVKLAGIHEVIGVYNEHPVNVPNATVVKADLTKDASRLINEYKPNVVIHTAAVGNVDQCEDQPDLCYRVNVETSRILLREAYRVGSAIYYLSTDYVFDGERGLYNEDDAPRPINYYGLSKLLAEEITRALGGSIIRVAWVYGTGPGRVNFGRTVVEKLSRGEVVNAIIDQWSSPTLNTIIGEAMLRLVESRFTGVLHVTGPRMSRFDFAKAIARYFKFNEDLVKPIRLSDVNYKARRPRDSSLSNKRALGILNIPLNDIDYALSIFKSELGI
ncbi:SDR family oxidoreductase [Caldivirga maquilingensis]|uniref:dTDP-4-dehydrorhamnose reductase n=1 Tax=Caldivirga maquilingensis (strain ATCC 700844 / DSM 13496 / JCM 10307 / IC-167) TaxID=397948 RepID=A8M932_CALMQ|nr:NAD(P)-dependent oxidoreductase [Caldivirga maquilingensis]ABW02251.1 dTDP-4-dehydrorhamnose reductase [Caldivirga maquilingensis IC-167]